MTLRETSDTLAELEHQVVGVLREVGGGVGVGEIVYQLARRGRDVDPSDVVAALCELEERGQVTPWSYTLGPEAEQ